jgi:hypothetical protein
MNPNGIRFFFDSEFRDRYIYDQDFWIIMLGLSYWILFLFARDWAMRKFKLLLWLSIGLCAIGNFFGFFVFERGTALGALNGPLITLLCYRTLYVWFKSRYNKLPASPWDTYMSRDMTLMKDGLLNFVFVMISVFTTVLFAIWTNKGH